MSSSRRGNSVWQNPQLTTTTQWPTSPSERAVSATATRQAVLCRHATTNDSLVSVGTTQSAETASAANRSITIDRGQERPFTSRILVSVRFTTFDTPRELIPLSQVNYSD